MLRYSKWKRVVVFKKWNKAFLNFIFSVPEEGEKSRTIRILVFYSDREFILYFLLFN